MATNTTTPLSDDLARGEVRVLGIIVFEGMPGFVKAERLDDHTVWAYAPMHVMMEYGVIAHRIA